MGNYQLFFFFVIILTFAGSFSNSVGRSDQMGASGGKFWTPNGIFNLDSSSVSYPDVLWSNAGVVPRCAFAEPRCASTRNFGKSENSVGVRTRLGNFCLRWKKDSVAKNGLRNIRRIKKKSSRKIDAEEAKESIRSEKSNVLISKFCFFLFI